MEGSLFRGAEDRAFLWTFLVTVRMLNLFEGNFCDMCSLFPTKSTDFSSILGFLLGA